VKTCPLCGEETVSLIVNLKTNQRACWKCFASQVEPCRRKSGEFRAHFLTRDEAERFAKDPANVTYRGDVAHACNRCGYFHLSRPEWLLETMPTASRMVN